MLLVSTGLYVEINVKRGMMSIEISQFEFEDRAKMTGKNS
jgi:hypothetical protein